MLELPVWAESLMALLLVTSAVWLFGAAALGLADRARARAPTHKDRRP
jgi:hypothetical protein